MEMRQQPQEDGEMETKISNDRAGKTSFGTEYSGAKDEEPGWCGSCDSRPCICEVDSSEQDMHRTSLKTFWVSMAG